MRCRHLELPKGYQLYKKYYKKIAKAAAPKNNFIVVLPARSETAALSLGLETASFPVLVALGSEVELVLERVDAAVLEACEACLLVVIVDELAEEEAASSESFHGARTHFDMRSLSTNFPLLIVGVKLRM